MGRHSAPDDDQDESGRAAAAAVSTSPLGPLPTTPIAPVEPDPAPETAPSSAAAPDAASPATQPAPAPPSASRSDLHLLKTLPSLRAQCLAAVIVPFLLYTLVLVIISRTDVYLIWLWIPTVLAGAGVGHLLDRAHKQR